MLIMPPLNFGIITNSVTEFNVSGLKSAVSVTAPGAFKVSQIVLIFGF
jgi:hypothetical protein